MGKVKELQMDIQYILNVLSAHGEQKAVEAFENVRKAIPTQQVPMYGERIDTETGDVEDLYPMNVDVIENVRLTNNNTIVREVRFCQMDYDEPEDPEIGHYEYLKKSGQMKSFDIDK